MGESTKKWSYTIVLGGGFITSCLTLAALLAVLKMADSPQFRVLPPTEPSLISQLQVAQPRLLAACSGLNTYSNDFSPAKVQRAEMIGMENGIELVFNVVSSPRDLPSPLNVRSASNTCYIDINAAATEAYIGKRACHSLCDGQWNDNDPHSMGVPSH